MWDRSQTEECFLRNEEAILIHSRYVPELSQLHSNIFVRSALFASISFITDSYGGATLLHHSSVTVCTDLNIPLLYYQEQGFG